MAQKEPAKEKFIDPANPDFTTKPGENFRSYAGGIWLFGELLGQLYVEKHFKPEAKARMDEMIKNLVKAYEIRIKKLEWMSDVTKQKVLDKLMAFTPKIGWFHT